MKEAALDVLEDVQSIADIRHERSYLDDLVKLATKISLYKYSCLAYINPHLIRVLTNRIRNTQNIVENLYQAADLTEEEYNGYKNILEDSVEWMSTIELPENSFFFAYKNKEYYAVHIENKCIIESYKADQKIENDRKTYATITEWLEDHHLLEADVEFAVCLDYVYDWDFGEM
jgi:hypothetical protein